MDFAEQFANSSAGGNVDNETIIQTRANITTRCETPKYTVKEDNYIGDVLENKLVKNGLKSIVDKFYGKQIEEIQHSATELTQTTYPSLFSIYTYCCKTLEIKNIPIVYVTNKMQGFNALSVEVNDKKMILVSRRVATAISTEEKKFILGHELGHHQQGNLIGHTVNGMFNSIMDKSEIIGSIISDAIEVPLKRWCRRSEFNADRAGLLCCKDINIVKGLFIKLGMIEEINAFHQYKETGEDHPLLFTRYEELVKYATTI